MIVLGQIYRDRITGFEGVATGRAEYITGCTQVLIAPPVKTDGTFIDCLWFDEQRLELWSSDEPIRLDNGATPGPDKQAPIR